MKSNYIYIIIGIIAGGAGLLLGYFLFAQNSDNSLSSEHSHVTVEADNDVSEEIWTCSMHPQIRQNEPGECPICGMDLIPLESNASNNPLTLEMTEEAVKLSNIQTTIVGQKLNDPSKKISVSGKVQPDERLTSSQVVHIPGRIEKLFVSFTGEKVVKGQKIATIYSPELIAAQRELIEAAKLKDLNPALVYAAKEKLYNWKIDSSQVSKIELEGVIQNAFPVFADETGIVTKRRVSVGDYVKTGEPLFELVNLSRVWVLFDLYEEDIQNFKTGDKIAFVTPSLPNKTFNTVITFIDPIINPDTRAVSVRAEVANPRGILKPEMLVYGQLTRKSANNLPLNVPKSAVMWTGKRSVVYVKIPDTDIPSFEFREVELGEAFGNSYQVVSGLNSGEEVVTNGSFTIDAAAQLNNQSSMMNRSVKLKKTNQVNVLPDYKESTPSLFKAQLTELANVYLKLKDAFVETNSESAIREASEFFEQIKTVDMSLIEGDAHVFWMEQVEALEAHSVKIKESNDVKYQREQFDFLSQALIASVKVFGMSKGTLYVQHCPMVNNNEGADWISDEEKIRNPYFGDKMMKCGKVKATIMASLKKNI